jgi:hypothetical protein
MRTPSSFGVVTRRRTWRGISCFDGALGGHTSCTWHGGENNDAWCTSSDWGQIEMEVWARVALFTFAASSRTEHSISQPS